ncbi:hypothetical protein CPB83DRAFT_851556 [Crepidotus variabilis]|uniref:CNNM transmembrane domain-containing protein n=1 Tax=Crepidotus variabilis TaxID=179855 RepID=A0A9P6EI48_9AGAR|nr:hypothetical protein CPB83DRAFT_851556 [Crepidotus variabilis]
MVPVPISARNPHSTRLLYILFSAGTQYAPHIFRRIFGNGTYDFDAPHVLAKREEIDHHSPKFIVFVVLIPVLVLLSGLFAGLTLGYMSLDETQLNVLSISGTPEQRMYAAKIIPVRKNGHLLLVTLLLANMIVNETLPVIAENAMGGGLQAVIISTVLIIIFAEIIPQSLFTRHGLYLGAKMAGVTRVLIYTVGILAWPIAKLLEFVLGSHHGIIYRRGELKELIAMHSSQATHGGDLKNDTVAIIGATLDLQEKVVKQAMTPIEDVFMLSINAKLDYDLLKKICQTGHSRVPVYEEVEVPVRAVLGPEYDEKEKTRTLKVKKIIGIFLVKQCVLLDPKDATPLRKLPLNKVPFVPNNESLLGILDKFQEGRSHMAIVSRFSVEKAASVKKAVKGSLTSRLRARVGMRDSESESDSSGDEEKAIPRSDERKRGRKGRRIMDALTRKDSNSVKSVEEAEGSRSSVTEGGETAVAPDSVDIYAEHYDLEHLDKLTKSPGEIKKETGVMDKEDEDPKKEAKRSKIGSFQLPKFAPGMASLSMLEQSMPADAVLTKEGAAEFLQGFDPAVMPLGIITLEDVLEELIGEEIYDEFDIQGARGDPYQVPPILVQDADGNPIHRRESSAPPPSKPESISGSQSQGKASGLRGLGFFRTKSAPPIPRDQPEGEEKSTAVHFEEDSTKGTTGGPTLQMPRPIRSTGRSPPSVILEQHSSVSDDDDQVANMLVNAGRTLSGVALPKPINTSETGKPPTRSNSEGHLMPTPPSASAVPAHVSNLPPNTSRSGSPVPPLEAILLERKRRLHASGGHNQGGSASSTPVPQGVINSGILALGSSTSGGSGGATGSGHSTAASTAPAGASGGKGTRFKSSRLGGGDRTGVVVAEQVGAAYSPSPTTGAIDVKEDKAKEE